jgi:hypothetical protein
MKNVLLFIGFMFLLIGTGIWLSAFLISVREYDQYCELVSSQNLGTPLHYSAWELGRNINISFIVLFFVWLPFLDYGLRLKSYPYLRQKLSYKGLKRFSRSTSRSLYERLYALVFGYFLRVNQKVGAKIGVWFMKLETFEHVHLLTKVLKWVIIPFSLTYFFTEFFFFKNNVLDSMLIGVTLFFYSNFVPDLPAIFRRKVYRDERDAIYESLSRYKTYALLVFAPFFILLLFCGKKITWKTTETFHNLKSLALYACFIFSVSFLVLLIFPISLGRAIESFCVPVYAILGYLTHLRVDLII